MLFVDDEASVRACFARTASTGGFLVDVAANGEEALELFRKGSYSVVATDLAMPGLDGISLIRALLQQRPDTHFVIVTGRDDVEVPADAALSERVTSIVNKPWDTDALMATLHRTVRLAEASRSRPPPAPLAEDWSDQVLLLEDSHADAALLEAYLESSHYEVCRVSRLSDALLALEQRRFGAIVTDLALPDARGLDTVLRLQNVANNTPLVVLSGAEDEVLAVQAVQAGAQDFLLKGAVDASSLVRSLRYAKERKNSELRLSELAYRDPLTGLANRAQFRQRLEQCVARSRRTGKVFAVLFVDLDNFKPVNDVFGHAAGDLLLAEVARRLEQAVRESDVVARLGGDEFAVILDDVGGSNAAKQTTERILAILGEPYPIVEDVPPVTASIGMAFYPESGSSANGLLKAADSAMYRAKQRGRNRYVVHDASPARSRPPAIDVRRRVREALKRQQFVLHYQPQYDVAAGRVVSAEALLRWRRAGGRLLPPAEFLPLLEESSEIVWVGNWVIQRACYDLLRLSQERLPLKRVAVNVSVKQLDRPDLVHTVRQALGLVGLEPSQLEIEVTETSVMRNPDQAMETLAQLKELGVSIALDDFGTGYSSLSHLYRLPIDTVKIDQSFVRDLETSAQCRAITSGMVGLAKKLGLTVVGEGVETRAQRDFLVASGCDLLQGFLYGRPGNAVSLRSEPAA